MTSHQKLIILHQKWWHTGKWQPHISPEPEYNYYSNTRQSTFWWKWMGWSCSKNKGRKLSVVVVQWSNTFIPESWRLKSVIGSKEKDNISFEVQRQVIQAELQNLITHGIFIMEDPNKLEMLIPTSLILKIKLKSDSSWDKAKSCICICGDVQLKKHGHQLQQCKHLEWFLQMQ